MICLAKEFRQLLKFFGLKIISAFILVFSYKELGVMVLVSLKALALSTYISVIKN